MKGRRIRRILISALLAAAVAPASAMAAPSASIDDVSHLEGNSGTSTMTFTVRLSEAAPAGGATMSYATHDGTAHAPGDYHSVSGTVSIPAGGTSAAIDVPVVGDTLSEGNETFTVDLSGPSAGVTIADGQGVGTIVDDDPLPSLHVNDVRVTEGNTGTRNATFTVSMSTVAGRDVSVHYATSDGSAKAPGDYTPVSGVLTIPAGATSRQVSVPVRGDTLDEYDETFNLNLSNAVGATIADSRGRGTIVDDDPAPSVSIQDARMREGDRGRRSMALVLTLSRASGKTISVHYATANGSAASGSDYVATSGTMTFPAGTTTRIILVPVIGDTRSERDETFLVRLSRAHNVSIRRGTAVGTILNDDFAPRLFGLRISPRVFPAASRGGSLARATGTTVRFHLSKAARVTFRVQVVRRCGRGCSRRVTLRGSFSRSFARGLHTARFTGRLRHRALPPGRYWLTAVARDATGGSPLRAVYFRIARR